MRTTKQTIRKTVNHFQVLRPFRLLERSALSGQGGGQGRIAASSNHLLLTLVYSPNRLILARKFMPETAGLKLNASPSLLPMSTLAYFRSWPSSKMEMFRSGHISTVPHVSLLPSSVLLRARNKAGQIETILNLKLWPSSAPTYLFSEFPWFMLANSLLADQAKRWDKRCAISVLASHKISGSIAR